MPVWVVEASRCGRRGAIRSGLPLPPRTPRRRMMPLGRVGVGGVGRRGRMCGGVRRAVAGVVGVDVAVAVVLVGGGSSSSRVGSTALPFKRGSGLGAFVKRGGKPHW